MVEKVKIGILKEGKNPPDKRVPLSPAQCKEILTTYSNVDLVVQPSEVRKYKDQEYVDQGIKLQHDLSDCDIIISVKEIPIEMLIPNKTHFFFSHTVKKQPYNRNLLLAILEKNITLVDWETLTNKKGERLIGFGKYAGIVGTYNGFLAWGKINDSYQLKPAHQCYNRVEMESEYSKIQLPENMKIVITGAGRVGHGAEEVLKGIGIKKVTPNEYLTQTFNEPVYTQLGVEHYNKTSDGSAFDKNDFYKDGSSYKSDFFKWAEISDMLITCHYFKSGSPVLITKEDLKNQNFKIKVIADISCDINGPIASTVRSSTIINPIYGYDPQTGNECDFNIENAITVMAVDNLPCELPKDASVDFGKEFISNILPNIIDKDTDNIIERAMITKNGKLTENFSYLQDYVDGKKQNVCAEN